MTTPLDTLLAAEKPLKILVVGDLIVDGYLEGEVGRTSPEAPVPVVLSQNTRHVAGGAANVANNLQALGCDTILAGVVGDDPEAAILTTLLGNAKIEHRLVTDSERPTTYKLRVVAQNQHMLRIDRESTQSIQASVVDALWQAIYPILRTVDGVIVSDYGKGVAGLSLLSRLMPACTLENLKVCVDPKGRDYARYRGAFMLTPNRSEVEQATGKPVDTPHSLSEAVQVIQNETHASVVLATCGADGMAVFETGAAPRILASRASEVFDVTGAGDTVVSVAAMGVFAGLSVEQAAELANLAAGVAVGKFGTVVVLPEELRAQVARGGIDEFAKILERTTAAAACERYRSAGKRVVFTNGCFDLLHAGHVHYLQQARRTGDVLILGLNTDASVSRLKGSTRPIVPERERAAVLSALESVTHVVFFDEDTPGPLIELLKPNVLVKGADWSPEKVVGKDFVEALGGELVLIEVLEGRSSTEIVKTILEREKEHSSAS